jgi:hypothetical protein
MDSLPRTKETRFHLDLSFHTEASDPALSLTPFPEDQATDLARPCVLVSHNRRRYERAGGLTVEDRLTARGARPRGRHDNLVSGHLTRCPTRAG